MSHISLEKSNHLARIRLQRPERQNRFTMDMLTSMGQIFADVEADPQLRCSLITSAGSDFCLGAEVSEVVPAWASGKSPFGVGQINPMGVSGPKRSKPLVVVVQGGCHMLGLELALAADICIAADTTQFAFDEIHFGTYPFGGGLFRFIRAAGWSNAMRYSLTGDAFDAAQAHRMHLVSQVCAAQEAEQIGLDIATRISQAAPLALRAAIGQAMAWADGGDVAGFARSIPDILQLLQSHDTSEALDARMKQRPPVFVGR